MNEIIELLIEHVRDESGYKGPIGADDDLIQAGILDSYSIVSLALFAQERFGIELEGDDLVRENVARLSALAKLIAQRRVA
jgi:acyl carrier protein